MDIEGIAQLSLTTDATLHMLSVNELSKRPVQWQEGAS
jgi:hypothetical protein